MTASLVFTDHGEDMLFPLYTCSEVYIAVLIILGQGFKLALLLQKSSHIQFGIVPLDM